MGPWKITMTWWVHINLIFRYFQLWFDQKKKSWLLVGPLHKKTSNSWQVSNDEDRGWLFHMGDDTTQIQGFFNKPLFKKTVINQSGLRVLHCRDSNVDKPLGFLRINQYFMEFQKGFVVQVEVRSPNFNMWPEINSTPLAVSGEKPC